MSQVNLLSVELAKTSGVQGDTANKQGVESTAGIEFSEVIDRHYQAQEDDSGDIQNKSNGNHKPQAANDHELLKSVVVDTLAKDNIKKPSDEQHTLPVPITAEVDFNTAPVESNTDTLPTIISPRVNYIHSGTSKIDAVSQKPLVDKNGLVDTLQVNKNGALVNKNDDTVDLLKMLNGAQKLIAEPSSNNVADKDVNLKNDANVKINNDIAVNYTAANETTKDGKLEVNLASGLTVETSTLQAEPKISSANVTKTSAQETSTVTTEQFSSKQAEKNMQISISATKAETMTGGSSTNIVTDEFPSEPAAETAGKDKSSQKVTIEAPHKLSIEAGQIEVAQPGVKTSVQPSVVQIAEQQTVRQNIEQVKRVQNSAVEFEDESVNLNDSNLVKNNLAVDKQPLEDALANKGNIDKKELSNTGNAVPSQHNANNQTAEITSASQHEVVKEPVTSRTVNQSTASVVAASVKEQSTSAANNGSSAEENSDKSGKNTDKSADEVAIVKTAIEKNSAAADKTASMVNQTLDANAGRSSLNAAELSMQQEKSFESTINQLSSNAVQTQKSITAVNTETIAIYRKDFANAVKDKVMVMINQKIQQVEIQLDPPEMGNVHVRVNLQNEQAAVQFIVQNQQAKDALEQNMGKLRDMLSENGVDVGDANIEQRQPGEQPETAFSDDKNGQQNGNASEQIADESHTQVHNVVKASSTGVDYYA